MRPLLLFGVLYFVFSHFIKVGGPVAFYPVVLLSNILLYTFFQDGTGAVSSVVDREALVRKVGFPRMVVPLAVTVVGAFNLLLNLVVLAVFLALNGVAIRWTWLLVPLPLLVMGVLATGVGMLLAALYVRFRDIKPIWDVVLQALFYATPILYPLQLVQEKSEDLAHILMASPLATLIQWLRRLLLGPDTPTPADAIGGAVWLLIPAAIIVVLVVVGFAVFERMAPRAAEEL
jgi:ABC-2 type transport system permease protein